MWYYAISESELENIREDGYDPLPLLMKFIMAHKARAIETVPLRSTRYYVFASDERPMGGGEVAGGVRTIDTDHFSLIGVAPTLYRTGLQLDLHSQMEEEGMDQLGEFRKWKGRR